MANIITASEARQYIPKLKGVGEDALIDVLVDAVDADFARFLGFPAKDVSGASPTITDTVYTEYYDGPVWGRPNTLDLGFFPLTAVTTVHSDPNRVYGADTLIANTEFDQDGREGLLILKTTGSGSFSVGKRFIKVVFNAGCPPGATVDIKLAAKLHMQHIWRLRNQGGHTKVTREGGSSDLRQEKMSLAVQQILRPWRLPRAEGFSVA